MKRYLIQSFFASAFLLFSFSASAQTYLPAQNISPQPSINLNFSALQQAQAALNQQQQPAPRHGYMAMQPAQTPSINLPAAPQIRLKRPTRPNAPAMNAVATASNNKPVQEPRPVETPMPLSPTASAKGSMDTASVSIPVRPQPNMPINTQAVPNAPRAEQPSPENKSTTSNEIAVETKGEAQTETSPTQLTLSHILFAEGSANLTDSGKVSLDKLAQSLMEERSTRIQLIAFASGTPQESSKARRLSLARALAVRSYLMAQGINAPRIDVRAMGLGDTALATKLRQAHESQDRVDLRFIR